MLRDLLTVQLLLGRTVAGMATLKRIIGLPGKRKPKQIAQDKACLANLVRRLQGVETDPVGRVSRPGSGKSALESRPTPELRVRSEGQVQC